MLEIDGLFFFFLPYSEFHVYEFLGKKSLPPQIYSNSNSLNNNFLYNEYMSRVEFSHPS